MNLKYKVLTVLLATAVSLSFFGCNSKKENKPESDASPVESSQSASSSESSEEESDTPVATENKTTEGRTSTTVGNISFSYPENLVVLEDNGIHYYYFNDTTFFYVDPAKTDLGPDGLTAEGAEEFFNAAVESFGTGDWANGHLVSEIEGGTMNDVPLWIAEIETDHVSEKTFTSSIAITFNDNVLTTFCFVVDNDFYDDYIEDFADVVASVHLAS